MGYKNEIGKKYTKVDQIYFLKSNCLNCDLCDFYDYGDWTWAELC